MRQKLVVYKQLETDVKEYKNCVKTNDSKFGAFDIIL